MKASKVRPAPMIQYTFFHQPIYKLQVPFPKLHVEFMFNNKLQFKRFITSMVKKSKNNPLNQKVYELSTSINKWRKKLDKLISGNRRAPGQRK